MDWFSAITGFDERVGYDEVQRRLSVVDGRLRSTHSDRAPRVGTLELVSVAELRARGDATGGAAGGPNRTGVVVGEARGLHRDPRFEGALIQAASQFNLLEMVGPSVTPEAGVTGYAHDHTQGPACALATGAATIFRNYLVPVDGVPGQRSDRQLDGLADLGAALAAATHRPIGSLWTMSNGYALVTSGGLDAIADHLAGLGEEDLDRLRGLLRIGLVTDAEVTDVTEREVLVSQAYCSGLPVRYSDHPDHPGWEPFARLVLEATYEATLLAAIANARRGVSATVPLTRVGGGVFGNRSEWIDDAVARALAVVPDAGLEVLTVRRG